MEPPLEQLLAQVAVRAANNPSMRYVVNTFPYFMQISEIVTSAGPSNPSKPGDSSKIIIWHMQCNVWRGHACLPKYSEPSCRVSVKNSLTSWSGKTGDLKSFESVSHYFSSSVVTITQTNSGEFFATCAVFAHSQAVPNVSTFFFRPAADSRYKSNLGNDQFHI